ncbi:MAG: CBS domain-containing protein [Bacteroidota bacterium]
MKAKDILATKPKTVFSISEDYTVFDVVAELAKNRIGFLVVTNTAGSVSGVISERDVVHKCVHQKRDPLSVRAKEIMTPKEKLIAATEDDDIQTIMNTMTERKIRHIPVFKDSQLLGVISIGDVIKYILDAKDKEIKTLSEYAFGQYPA